MKNSLSEVFNKVPTKSIVKEIYNSNSNYNLKLLSSFRSECYLMCGTYFLDKKTTNNFFEYLYKNLNVKKLDESIKISKILLESIEVLDNQLKENVSQTEESIQSINHIKNNISIFLIKIADKHNFEAKDFIKKVNFDRMMNEIFVKKNKNIIPYLENNIKILNYKDFNNNTFDELLYKEFIKYKSSKNIETKIYYLSLIKVLLLLPNIDLDKKKYYEEILKEEFNSVEINNKSYLTDKINSLEYKTKSKRYLLLDDFTFSIDSDNTKKRDDAFSIEKIPDGYLVGIHIADVVSLGFDDKFIFDDESYLSSSGYAAASLVEGNTKNSNSLFLEIDNNGKIREYIFLPTKIKLNCNVYDKDLEDLILHNKVGESLSNLNEEDLNILISNVFNMLNLYCIVNNKELIKYPDAHNIGNNIVEKFMLLYNSILSSYFDEKGYPYIYLNGDKYNSSYSLNNEGYNTGFEDFKCYGKATSPIIDKVSCISQVLLNKCYYAKPSKEEIEKIENKLKVYVKKLNSNRQ